MEFKVALGPHRYRSVNELHLACIDIDELFHDTKWTKATSIETSVTGIAVGQLQTQLREVPVLLAPNLHSCVLAAVLFQEHPTGRRIITYASSRFNATERRYHINEQECLAVIWAIKRFRPYLEDRKFTLRTDSRALLWLDRTKDSRSKLTRWALLLQEFNFSIEHCPGKENELPDELSQGPHQPTRPLDVVSLDLIGPLQKTRNGKRNIIVYTDLCTRWYSYPKSILRDNEPQLRSAVWEEAAVRRWDAIDWTTPVYHPQANTIEKINQVIKKELLIHLANGDNASAEELYGTNMVRNYVRKTQRASGYTEEQLENALNDIRNGNITLHRASQTYGIPKTTLFNRLTGKRGVKSQSLGRPLALGRDIEEQLAVGLKTLERWGFGLSRSEILHMIAEYVTQNNSKTPFKNNIPGEDWFLQFKKRYNLSIKKPQGIEYAQKLKRNTPHCVTGETPSKLMFSRKVKTRLDFLSQREAEKVRERQIKYHGGKRDVNFSVGEMVYVKDFRNVSKSRWTKAVIRLEKGKSNIMEESETLTLV
ncbi:RNase H-like domain found in reverse transcriptase [Popillia japonica]|uniref:RNase H-like domain found in reverse transcriptase n=1 Tax=Popillia japonica TaxID=7064 RepID=A0AAW1JGR4_POPJA